MVSEFAYDGLGNRYQSGVGVTTTFSLDTASDLAQVLAGGGTLYYYGLERIAQQRTGGQPAYFLTDQLGSARHLVDAGGSILRSQSFDPFGNLLSASGSTLTSYGYAGEWHDPSGLLHLRARYYAPSQGRFLTRDPFPGLLSHPATQPPYPYALNNPLRYTDPSGQFAPMVIIAGIGFAAGAVFDAYQQTSGFTTFCNYDILQTLAWGVGGAAAATSFAILTVSGVGLFGLGLQGMAMGMSGLGISSAAFTPIFLAGTSAASWSATAMAWLAIGNPIYSNPGMVANSRANALQQSLPQYPGSGGRITMAAGIVENQSGTRHILIGTSEPYGYIRPQVRPFIRSSEIIVSGTTHAEENIVRWAQSNDLKIIAVAAGRPICPNCAKTILDAGGIIASPIRTR